MSVYVPPREKAIVGPGAATMQTNPPLSAGLFLNDPRALMRSYWQVAHRNPWINGSEGLISGKVATVDWHLEQDGEEVDAASSPFAAALVRLFENPQANAPVGRKMTRREFWMLTSRFMGLCGPAFWFLDERNAVGLPNSTLWIRPDRMTPAEDARGNLTGWVLDQGGVTVNGQQMSGIPLELDQVLQFNLTPPDDGHFGMGNVEAAVRKSQLVDLADSYASGTLSSGGRLSGLVTGTPQAPIPDEVFKQLVRDLRAVTEQPDAARRTTVLQGPVDWKATGMTPLEVGLLDLMKLSRDDIFGIWRAPFSLVYGGTQAAGLNSGDTRKYDEASLWQGPVHDRLTVMTEVIQYQFLDQFSSMGNFTIVVDEPEFDDDSPRYDLLQKSLNTPLRNRERRALIGLDPFGDPAVDEAVWLPITQVAAFSAPVEPDEEPTPTEIVLGRADASTSDAAAAAGETSAGKASLSPKVAGLHNSLVTLRANVQTHFTPPLRRDVAGFLERQRKELARSIRRHAAHLAEKPSDSDAWWNGEQWDRQLLAVMSPRITGVASTVIAHIGAVLPTVPAKAGPVGAADRVLTRGAARVTRINDTTRAAIQAALVTAIDEGQTIGDVADAIETGALGVFDEYRSELIARTELMDAYNAAALGSYSDAGLSQVQAIDGDDDEECAQRDGEVFDIDEADGIEDHPNGTLDWVPVIGDA